MKGETYMEEIKLCNVCGTPMVKSNQTLKMDGSRKLDGSWGMKDLVCPKCHPELAQKDDSPIQ